MIPTRWTQAPDDIRLPPCQVDVWRVFLDLEPASVKAAESTLSADEAKRASRFHFDRDRTRFIVAHASLRNILARTLHCEPRQLNLSANAYGKPFLPDHKVEFNLSHSGGYALVAVSRQCRVGVDVERIRPDMETAGLARRFFSPAEVSELMALSPEQQTTGFFLCWTRKEAYIKAQGLGLSLPLDSFDMSLAPDEPAILRATRSDPLEAARWTLLSLDVEFGYAGALAAEGAGRLPDQASKDSGLDFRFWDWRPAPMV